MEEWLTFHSSFHLFQDPSVVQFLNNKKIIESILKVFIFTSIEMFLT